MATPLSWLTHALAKTASQVGRASCRDSDRRFSARDEKSAHARTRSGTLALVLNIFTARVRDGRLALDDTPISSELSEGESIDLVSIDELLLNGGALSEEDERAALDRALAVSSAEAKAGLVVDYRGVLERLRGKNLPHASPDQPPGDSAIESIDEAPPLSLEQQEGIDAAITSLNAGEGRTLAQTQTHDR